MYHLLANTGRYVTSDLSFADSLLDAHAFYSPNMALRVAYTVLRDHASLSDISVQDVTTRNTVATAWRSTLDTSPYA